MGIVVGSALAPEPLVPLFEFWFEDGLVREWGQLLKLRFDGDISDLKLQAEEVAPAIGDSRRQEQDHSVSK